MRGGGGKWEVVSSGKGGGGNYHHARLPKKSIHSSCATTKTHGKHKMINDKAEGKGSREIGREGAMLACPAFSDN